MNEQNADFSNTVLDKAGLAKDIARAILAWFNNVEPTRNMTRCQDIVTAGRNTALLALGDVMHALDDPQWTLARFIREAEKISRRTNPSTAQENV